MPTFYAIIAASTSALVVNNWFKEFMGPFSAVPSFVAWMVVFYALKKWLTDLRP